MNFKFGRTILQGGGVLTDAGLFGVVRSDITGEATYVPQPLAVPIKKGGQRHLHAHLAKMSFVSSPKVLAEVQAVMRAEPKLLRHLVVKQSVKHDLIPPAPRSAAIPPSLLAAVEEINARAAVGKGKKGGARA